MKAVSRRNMLKLVGFTGAGAALTACTSPVSPTTTPAPTQQAAQPAAPTTDASSPTVAAATVAPAPTTAIAAPTAGSTESPTLEATQAASSNYTTQEFDVPSYPHDVAPDPNDANTVWWTAQGAGELGRFNPATGESKQVPLGNNSSPHGVIIGPDGHAWVTDSGQNAIVRVDAKSEAVTVFPLPDDAPRANLNTCAFDGNGVLWFTGQTGFYGSVNSQTGEVKAWPAPRGRGPYGIDATPEGRVFYASLAGSHIAEIDTQTGAATPIDPPTKGQGARRVWSDSTGSIWVSEWNAGQVSKYDPAANAWQEWKLPGANPQTYAVYVDERDIVWLSDFGDDTLWAFDPSDERFTKVPHSQGGNVRQMLGRTGEMWAAESGANKLMVVRWA